jgi:hypothetical protein
MVWSAAMKIIMLWYQELCKQDDGMVLWLVLLFATYAGLTIQNANVSTLQAQLLTIKNHYGSPQALIAKTNVLE